MIVFFLAFVYEKKTLPLRVICNVFTDLPFMVIGETAIVMELEISIYFHKDSVCESIQLEKMVKNLSLEKFYL